MTLDLRIGDCVDELAHIEPGSVALTIADLPFGITRAEWDKKIDLEKIWPLLRRASKPDAVFLFFAANRFTHEVAESNREQLRFDLVWHKNKMTGGLNSKVAPLREHETILAFYAKRGTFNPQRRLGKEVKGGFVRSTGGEVYGRQSSTRWAGGAERYFGSVLTFDVVNNDDPDRIHSSQKPLGLLEYLIRTFSNPGDLVLDPSAGSCSTAIASERTDRRCISIEKREASGAKCPRARYDRHMAQGRLGLGETA